VCQAVDLARATRTPLPLVEGRVNASQHGFQRNAGVLPDFHQRPVQRRQQGERAAASLEVVLDLGEIVEVVIHAGRAPSIFTSGVLGGAPLLRLLKKAILGSAGLQASIQVTYSCHPERTLVREGSAD